MFVEAIDNLSIAVFLTNSRTTTLPVEAYSYIRDFDDPTVAAMAALLMLPQCSAGDGGRQGRGARPLLGVAMRG